MRVTCLGWLSALKNSHLQWFQEPKMEFPRSLRAQHSLPSGESLAGQISRDGVPGLTLPPGRDDADPTCKTLQDPWAFPLPHVSPPPTPPSIQVLQGTTSGSQQASFSLGRNIRAKRLQLGGPGHGGVGPLTSPLGFGDSLGSSRYPVAVPQWEDTSWKAAA